MSARATSSKRDPVLSCSIMEGERHSQSALGGAILGGSGQPGDVSELDVRRARLTLTFFVNKACCTGVQRGCEKGVEGGRGLSRGWGSGSRSGLETGRDA